MEALAFFVLTPLTAGIIQFFLSRSRLPRWVKWGPAVLVMLAGMVCFLGAVDFPDYFYGMLFSLPALFGLGAGALFSVAQWSE